VVVEREVVLSCFLANLMILRIPGDEEMKENGAI